jgi:hypothetical protein
MKENITQKVNEMQTNLVGDEAKKAWEEALGEAEAHSPYFKPETNKEYVLTFSGWKIGMVDFPKRDQQGVKITTDEGDEILEPKLTLTLWIDSINGENIGMLEGEPLAGKKWNSTSKKVRDSLRMACQHGTLMKKKWGMLKTGTGYQTTYSFTDIGER